MKCDVCSRETADVVGMRSGGETLMVCSVCRSSGTQIKRPEYTIKKRPSSPEIAPQQAGGKMSLAEDFSKKIQSAMQKKDITFEDLGKKIFEKESTLKKVASGSLTPEDALIVKLEKTLDISLRERV